MLADADKKHFQIVINGLSAAGGTSTKKTANVLYYRRTSFGTALSYAELTTAFHTKMKTPWKAAVCDSWSWVSTSVRNIDSPTDAGAITTVGETGDIATQAVPSFVAMLISKLTASRGRSYRGRCYISGLAEADVDINVIDAGQLVLLQAIAAAMDDSITTAAGLIYVPYNFSATLSNILVEPAVVIGADITSCIARLSVASMNSRKKRV